MKRVLVPLAHGFEEIEAITVIDVLRRADIEVVVAGTSDGTITGSRGIRVAPDTSIDEIDVRGFDLIVVPGGLSGAEALRKDPRIIAALSRHHEAGGLTAAICAGPTVLAEAGLLAGRRVTSHPSVRKRLSGVVGEVVADERVVVDGTIVTSQGPGTAMEFAFRLVELLCGKEKVAELNSGILARTS